MTDGLKNLTTKVAFNGLTATASVGMKKLNKICLEENNAKLHPQVQRYKQQKPSWIGWFVTVHLTLSLTILVLLIAVGINPTF